MRALLLLAALLVARPGAIPAVKPTGPAQSCVPISNLRESRVRSDRVIDFIVAGRKAYRATLAEPCPQLGFERRFGYRTSLGRLCSTDIIAVLTTGPIGRGASCGLAPFQPVMLSER